MLEKKPISLEDIEAQPALELPDREMMGLVTVIVSGNTVIIQDLVHDVTVAVDVNDVNVGANVCAQVLSSNSDITCEVTQN